MTGPGLLLLLLALCLSPWCNVGLQEGPLLAAGGGRSLEAAGAADFSQQQLPALEPFLAARFVQPAAANASVLEALGEHIGFLLRSRVFFAQHLDHVAELENGTTAVELFEDARHLATTRYAGADELGRDVLAAVAKLRLLGNGSCHPILRRVLLGAVLAQRLRAGTWGPGWAEDTGLQQALAQLAHQLYLQHRNGAANKVVTEFMHVSKSGGTSMCELSALNGCRSRDTR